MSLAVLLAIFLKATALSFSGFGSLPVLHQELVTNRGLLTNDELNQAVAVARATPGPMGSYVVAVGYMMAGWPGAAMGWIAMSAPALMVLPISIALRRRSHSARWQSAIEAMILASAGLVLATARTLIPTAVIDVPTTFVAAGALLIVLVTRVPTTWVIVAGAVVTLLWR